MSDKQICKSIVTFNFSLRYLTVVSWKIRFANFIIKIV